MCEEIPINKITDSYFLYRKKIDEDLDYLEHSINKYGLLCPIIVRMVSNGYQLISGRRRLLACKNLGYKTIPAIVKNVSSDEAIEIALQENVQRASPSSIEEAEIIHSIYNKRKMADKDFCAALGLSLNELNLGKRLNDLSGVIKTAVFEGKLTERQALSLTRTSDREIQMRVFDMLISHYYSDSETEYLVSKLLEKNN